MRKGRELELLVAQLEHILGEGAFQVRSPERIRNRHTRDLVEVDVTLRGRVGSSDVLIALECRDRSKTGDVNWIRELATKRDDIGANAIVAVARSGFTRDARNEAAAKLVQLRSFTDLSPDAVAEVLLGVQVTAHRPLFNVTAIEKVAYQPFSGAWPPFDGVLPRLTMEKLDDLIARTADKDIFDEKEQHAITFKEMIGTGDWRSPYEGLDVGATRTVRTSLPCYFTDRHGRADAHRFRWHFSDLEGIVFTEVVVAAEVFFRPEQVQLSKVLGYSGDAKRVASVAEFDLGPYGYTAKALRVVMINEAERGSEG